jgi:tetratricopeptide (TPR) repeat protein
MRSDPETERYRLFDAVAAWLADASAESPVLLVLDDLHWAAKPTLLLLRHVVRSTEPLRLLMVATYRDTDIGRGDQLTEFLADLRREGMGDRLPLVGLDRAGVGAFIEAAAGHALPDEDSDELVRAVWEETEGNPFFVTEVMRHLAETGGVERRGGRWVTTAPIEDLGIPDGVRDVVGRRLSRLSPSAGRILGVAAIAGLEFEPAVVGVAAGLDDEELFSALEAAATARLVSEVPGGVRYRFFHALVRATLYDEISGPRRVALHRNVAQAIEALHGRHLDDYLPALTHHWSKAAVPAADADRAMEYARRAGDRALVQLAHDEAAAYYNQALTLADAAGVGPHDARRQELLISLGEAQRRAGDPAHRETLLSAAALARRRGDAHALARAALANSRAMIMATVGTIDAERVGALEAAVEAIGEADSAVRAKLLAILALETIHGDDVTRRVQLSDEALAIARRLDEPATLTAVLMARQYTINNPATLTERLSNTAEMVRLADRIGDPVTRCRAAFVRYRCVLENGDVATADSVFDAGEALAHELGQPTLLWMSGWNRAAWLARRGRFREAEETSTTTRELGRATGQGDADAFFAVQMSRVRREQGRIGEFDSEARDAWERWPIRVMEAFLAESYSEVNPAKAEEMLGRVSLDGFAALPFDYTWIATMSAWASVAIRLDDIAAMATIYEKLSPFSEQTVVSAAVVCGAVQHHLGALAAALGELDRAEEHLAAAAETHKRMALPTWVAHTAVERGAVLFRRNQPGDRDKAVTLLEQALAGAVEYGLLADERRVRELLADGGR